jgi:hypothetical protein
MAGAGYKLFATGDVLTAAQVNTFLMQQTTMVFADSAARTLALSGVLAEGMVSYLQDTNSLEVYDGAAWIGATGDITALTAGTGISITSATGPIPTVAIDSTVATLTGSQTLTNKTLTAPVISTIENTGTLTLPTSTDTLVGRATSDTLTNKTLTSPVISTITNTGTLTLPTSTDTLVGRATTDTLTNKTLTSPALTTPTISTLTTNGDLLYGTGSGALSRLGIGTTGQVLTVSGGLPAWATPTGGGGKVLQVVSTTKTDTFTTTSASYVDVTGYSVTITPSSSTSKILVLYDININADPSTHGGWGRLVRGSTDIKIGDSSGGRPQVTIAKEAMNFYNDLSGQSGSFLDSPATTSATTYKIQVIRIGGTGSDIVCVNRTEQDNTDRPRGACTITVLEIGA